MLWSNTSNARTPLSQQRRTPSRPIQGVPLEQLTHADDWMDIPAPRTLQRAEKKSLERFLASTPPQQDIHDRLSLIERDLGIFFGALLQSRVFDVLRPRND